MSGSVLNMMQLSSSAEPDRPMISSHPPPPQQLAVIEVFQAGRTDELL
jgi:hypothetical protein